MNDVGQVARHSKCTKQKQNTPTLHRPFPFTESSACECEHEHEWICQLFKTLRTGTFRQFSVWFHCVGSFNKYNTYIENHSFESYSSGTEMDTHTLALFETNVSISGVGLVYLNGSKRNSVIHYAREETTTSSHHIHREIKSNSNEWIYAWNTDLNVHFEIKHEWYDMYAFVCAKISRRTKWALKPERKRKRRRKTIKNYKFHLIILKTQYNGSIRL